MADLDRRAAGVGRMHQAQPDAVGLDVAFGRRLGVEAQPAVGIALDRDHEPHRRRDRKAAFEPDPEAAVEGLDPLRLEHRLGRSPVGVAQHERQAVPDLAAVAAQVQQPAAAQPHRERPGMQRQRRLDRLVGAEQPAGERRRRRRRLHRCRQIVRPPSTGSSTPVMKAEASLAR